MCLAARPCLTLCHPVDRNPPGCSVHAQSPGKNSGGGCHALLQGNLPNPGIEPRSPASQADSSPSEPPGKILHLANHKHPPELSVLKLRHVLVYKPSLLFPVIPGSSRSVSSSSFHGALPLRGGASEGDCADTPPRLGRPSGEVVTAHSSILAWELPWTEEPRGLQSLVSQRSWTRLSDSTTNSEVACALFWTSLEWYPATVSLSILPSINLRAFLSPSLACELQEVRGFALSIATSSPPIARNRARCRVRAVR